MMLRDCRIRLTTALLLLWNVTATNGQESGSPTDSSLRPVRPVHTYSIVARDPATGELGQALGCDPDVVEAACLAHDLGHPPFGHNGESVLDEIATDIGGFEGNAQTLRVLTRLEPKIIDPATGRGAGLNLTRAGLDATTKYPWLRGAGPSGTAPGKFGAYADDLPVFTWLREGTEAEGTSRRCLEAQVMDVCDDIAYSVHDVEDAIVGGHLDPTGLADADAVAQVEKQARDWYLPDAGSGELADALARLQALPVWVGEFDGSRRALAALKDLTSQLIGRFTRAAETATRSRHGDGRLTRYAADLVLPRETLTEVAVLKGVAAVYVMTAAGRRPLYTRQRELLAELHEALLDRAPDVLEPAFADDWRAARALGDADAACRRVVVDQIASLTDPRAVAWHAELVSSPSR